MEKYRLQTALALLAFLLATGIWFYDTYVTDKPIGEYPQAIYATANATTDMLYMVGVEKCGY